MKRGARRKKLNGPAGSRSTRPQELRSAGKEPGRHHQQLFTGERLFLFGDDRTLRRELGVELLVVLPLFGKVVFVKNRFHWTLGNARLAVDALFGVDVQHRLPLIKALYRAHDDAIRVFAVETRLGYDVGHYSVLSLESGRFSGQKPMFSTAS